MRVASIIAVLLCSAMIAQAQMFTQNNLPTIGTEYTWTQCDTVGILPGPGGQGQTWDFSNVTQTNESQTLKYIDPATTPNGNQFPDATIAEESDTAFSYYGLAGGFWTRYGETSDAFQSGQWEDPLHLAKVPWSFGESFTDEAKHQFTTQGQTFDRTGTIEAELDGTGTLILPTGTFDNVVRVAFRQVIHDTAELDLGPVTVGTGITVEIVAWVWYQQDNPTPLFSVDTAYTSIITSGPQPFEQRNQFAHVTISNAEGSGGTTPPPTLGMPMDMARIEGGNVTFSWTRNMASDQVRIQIAVDSEFTETVLDTIVDADELEVTDLAVGVQHYWRLATVRTSEISKPHDVVQEGDWSASRSFVTIPFPPEYVSPDDGATVGGMPGTWLNWTPTTELTQIQISESEDFQTTVLDETTDQSSNTLPVDPGQYYWRLRAIPEVPENHSNWTAPRMFRYLGTSVIELSETDLSLAPNPAPYQLTVEGDDIAEFTTWKLVEVTGREVMEGAITSELLRVDVSAIPQGSYVLVLSSAKHVVAIPAMVSR